jgi:hypothetical protein
MAASAFRRRIPMVSADAVFDAALVFKNIGSRHSLSSDTLRGGRYATSGMTGKASMSFPTACLATRKSYEACRLSQNSGLLRNQ